MTSCTVSLVPRSLSTCSFVLRRAHGALNFLLAGDLCAALDPCGGVGDEGAIESVASRCFKLMLGGISFAYTPDTCYEVTGSQPEEWGCRKKGDDSGAQS